MSIRNFKTYTVSLDTLYERFAPFSIGSLRPQPGTVLTLDKIRLLQSTPLRKLTGRELEGIAYEILVKWGNVDIFRYFLPRFLDLITAEQGVGSAHKEVILGKLQVIAHFRTWPMQEQSIVIGFLRESWVAMLQEDGGDYIDALSEYFHYYSDYIAWEWLLLRWVESTAPTALKALQEYIDFIFRNVVRGKRIIETDQQLRNVLNYLIAMNVPKILRNRAQGGGSVSPELGSLLVIAADQLDILHRKSEDGLNV